MAYRLPNFNLMCNIYGNNTGVPILRLESPCNLQFGRKSQSSQINGGYIQTEITMFLLLPARTDIRMLLGLQPADSVECPAGSGKVYTVWAVDDVMRGFATEYRCAKIFLTSTPWPMP